MPAPLPEPQDDSPLLTLGGAAGAAPSQASEGMAVLDRTRHVVRFYRDEVGIVTGSNRKETRCRYADIGHIEIWRPHRIVVELGASHAIGPRRINLFGSRFHLEDRFHRACELIESHNPTQFSSLDDGALQHTQPLRPGALFEGQSTRSTRFDIPAQEIKTDHASYSCHRGPGTRGGLLVYRESEGDREPLLFVDGRALHNAHGSVYAWVRILTTGTRILEWGDDQSLVASVHSGLVHQDGQVVGTLRTIDSRTSIEFVSEFPEAIPVALLAAMHVPRPPENYYNAQSTETAPAIEIQGRGKVDLSALGCALGVVAFGAIQVQSAQGVTSLAALAAIVTPLILWLGQTNYHRTVGFPRFFAHHAVLPQPSLDVTAPPTLRVGLRDIGRIEVIDQHIEFVAMIAGVPETRRYRSKQDPEEVVARILEHLETQAPGHVVGRSRALRYSREWTWEELFSAWGTTRALSCNRDASRTSITVGDDCYSCPLRDGGRRVLHRIAGSDETILQIRGTEILSFHGMVIAQITDGWQGTKTIHTGAGPKGERFEVRENGTVWLDSTEVASLYVAGQTIRCRLHRSMATALGMVFLLVFDSMQPEEPNQAPLR